MAAPFAPGSSPAADAELRSLVRRAAREELHRRGDLEWLLDSNQQGIVAQFDDSEGADDYFVLECARRLGKTFLLAWLALRMLHRKPNARVVYCGPTIKAVLDLLVPSLLVLERDAPPEWRHSYNSERGQIRYPAVPGYISVFGCDDQKAADRGRGPGADLVLVDEAGFISILGYVVGDVLRPQTLTTGGRIALASSPSREPDHEFSRMADATARRGAYVKRTIFDNPRITPERIQRYVEADADFAGMTPEEFVKSDRYLREYLAERAIDRTLVGVPEWPDVAQVLTVERERPEYWDAYVGLDYGGADPHAALFGYLDFERGVLVIEDEVLLREGENTQELAEAIRDRERALWGTDGWDGTLRALHEAAGYALPESWIGSNPTRPQPYLRVADHDVQLTRDLQELHGIAFAPALKTDKRHAVDRLRVMLRQGKVEVHPRCRNLDRHLRQTVWANERRKEWRRTAGGEHGDLVDVLLYLSRAVDWTRNPWPQRRATAAAGARGLAAALAGGRR